MNCHQNIAEYNGEEDLENGYTKDFYTKEIKKLYAAVGWDETNQQYTGETQPVKWVRIHNLPDFVYFNHAQHVEVGEIACQTVTVLLKKWRLCTNIHLLQWDGVSIVTVRQM